MANYLSQPTKYGEPKSQFNAELASKVLQAKQGQYDINKARVDAVLGEYQNLEFINAKAKEDFYNNIQGVLNEVNSSNLRDLGDTNVADRILSSINKALTPETLKHNQIAKAYYASEKKWEELFKKDPKLYSDGNKRYVDRVSGINDYIQNGDYSKVNLSMLTNPIAYTDYDANGRKAISEIQSARGKEVQEWYDADGIPHKLDTSSLSISDIFMVRENIFNDKDRMQMRIDASNEFHSMTPEQVREATLNINQMKIGQVELDLRKLGSIETSGYITDDQKKAIADKKQALEIYKEQLSNFNYDTVSNDENSLQYIKENTVLAALANSIGVDPSRKINMPAHVYNNIQKGKESKKVLDNISVYATPTGPEDQKNLYTSTYKNLRDINRDIKDTELGIFENITHGLTPEEIKTNMDSIRNRADFKSRFPDATEEDLKIAYIDEYGKNSKNRYGNETVEEAYQRLVNLRVSRDELDGVVSKGEDRVNKLFSIDFGDKAYEFINNRRGPVSMLTLDGDVVHADKYLEDLGVVDKESFLSFLENEDLSKEFKTAYYASVAHSEFTNSTYPSKTLVNSFKETSRLLGEDLDLFDAYTFFVDRSTTFSLENIVQASVGLTVPTVEEMTREEAIDYVNKSRVGKWLKGKVTMVANPKTIDSRTMTYLAGQGLTSYTISIYDPSKPADKQPKGNRSTTTLGNTPTMKNLANPDTYAEEFNRVLIENGMGKTNVAFSLPNMKEFDEVFQQAARLTSAETAIDIDKRNLKKGEVSGKYPLSHKRPATFSFNRLSRDLINITQLSADGTPQTVNVPITTVKSLAPDIYKKIMEYGTEETVKYRVNTSQRSDNINYISNKDILRQRLNHFGSPELINMANKQSAKNLLKTTLESNIGQDSQGVYSDVTAAIDNSNSFSVEIENVQDTNYPYYKYNLYHGDELIGSQVREGSQPTEREWGILELMPSAIMTIILNSAIIDFNETGDINNSETLVNLRRALQKIQQKKQVNQ